MKAVWLWFLVILILIAGPTPEFGRQTGSRAVAQSGGTFNDIQHIVFIIKENRTFDNYFGRFPGADGAATHCLSTVWLTTLRRSRPKAPNDYSRTPTINK